ncbi:MAG: hypothetical protein QOG94_2794 [Solirubrobacteraceae bacterium]|nr:hypothetical protein [Solirubrobacteraceae bacterium]
MQTVLLLVALPAASMLTTSSPTWLDVRLHAGRAYAGRLVIIDAPGTMGEPEPLRDLADEQGPSHGACSVEFGNIGRAIGSHLRRVTRSWASGTCFPRRRAGNGHILS